MDHLQVAVLALRETIDRQEDRIVDLLAQRNALALIVVGLFIACVLALVLSLP